LEWKTLLPEGVAFHRGVIVAASPESLITDIMKIHSIFVDVPVGYVGHFTAGAPFRAFTLEPPIFDLIYERE